MAVSKQKKEKILAELVEKFKEAKSIWFASTTTLTVDDFFSLRKELREVWATYTLAKKTLIKKAIKEALNIELDLNDLPGQIWAVCSNEDSVAGLGKVNELVKKTKWEKVSWTISIFEWEVKSNDDTKVIADLPSRDTLLGRLVGSMKSPISALARFFDSAAKDLESNGKTKVWELEWKKEETTTEVKEEPKAEEKAEVPKTEVKEEVKEEAKVEEKAEEPKAEEKTEEK